MQKLTLNILIIFIGLFSISSTYFGQEMGVKSGVVFSSLKNVSGVNFRPGLQIGGYKNFGASERLFFRTEALLTQKGSWSWSQANLNSVSLAYFDISLLFCVDVTEKFNLNFGFQPSVLIAGRHRFIEDDIKQAKFVGNDVSRFDYSTLIGVEYKLTDNIFLGIRYNHSFIPVQGYGGNISVSGTLPLSRIFQVYAGLKLK